MRQESSSSSGDGGDGGDGGGDELVGPPTPEYDLVPNDLGGVPMPDGFGASAAKEAALPSFRWPGAPVHVHDPIDLRLADKVHVQVDYRSGGAAPLRLARSYHSNASAYPARVTMPIGTGWRTHYDRSLQVLSASLVRLHRANGQTMDLSFNGSTWVSSLPVGVLTQIAGGWQYINHRDVTETYDTTGRLSSLTDAGHVTTMQYDGSSRLIRVANPFGRALDFAYDGAGRVATVTLPGGSTLGYTYGSSNNLIAIRFADNSTRQYAYEDARFANALTGIVDESGRRRLTWAYDTAGRPNYGTYGSGVNSVSVVYNGSQVTTTDARGTQRTRTSPPLRVARC